MVPIVTEPWYANLGACPDCGLALELRPHNRCSCGFTIPDGAPLNMRPQSPQQRRFSFHVASSAREDLARMDVTRPAVTYDGPQAVRDSTELFSAAKPWLPRGARLLDLGCGPRDQATPAAYLGLDYVGIDFDSPNADLHADAHAIPFQNESFDAVVSYAVVEHLYNPFVAVADVARVLRRGGIFFGAVSQGEPFHDSYFHHTPFGVMSVMGEAGLQVTHLWPSYDTLHALAGMGRYPRAIRILINAVYRVDRALPFLAPRAFFRASLREKDLERLYRAASICFLAFKSAS
jgi:SAM-dependent methyltransferase